MKNFVRVAAALIVCSSAGGAAAQEAAPAAPTTGPLNTITVNPLSLAFGSINFEYERATSPTFSWFVGPQYASFSTSVLDDEFTASSYGLTGGVRFFLTGRAPEGFFISPNASLGYASAEAGGESASALSYSVGAIGGYTWIFGDVFDLSVGLGAQYMHTEVAVPDGDGDDLEIGFTGVLPALRLSLGVAF